LRAPAIVDQDTSYHVAVGRLMSQHGMLQAFPWTPFSWFADNCVDKEMMLHVLMMPLAGLEPLVCVRIVGSAMGFAVRREVVGLARAIHAKPIPDGPYFKRT
jgi:hypothetical protein